MKRFDRTARERVDERVRGDRERRNRDGFVGLGHVGREHGRDDSHRHGDVGCERLCCDGHVEIDRIGVGHRDDGRSARDAREFENSVGERVADDDVIAVGACPEHVASGSIAFDDHDAHAAPTKQCGDAKPDVAAAHDDRMVTPSNAGAPFDDVDTPLEKPFREEREGHRGERGAAKHQGDTHELRKPRGVAERDVAVADGRDRGAHEVERGDEVEVEDATKEQRRKGHEGEGRDGGAYEELTEALSHDRRRRGQVSRVRRRAMFDAVEHRANERWSRGLGHVRDHDVRQRSLQIRGERRVEHAHHETHRRAQSSKRDGQVDVARVVVCGERNGRDSRQVEGLEVGCFTKCVAFGVAATLDQTTFDGPRQAAIAEDDNTGRGRAIHAEHEPSSTRFIDGCALSAAPIAVKRSEMRREAFSSVKVAGASATGRPMAISYRDAGVDIDAGDELVERIKPLAKRTRIPGVLADVGGFAGLFAVPSDVEEPVLVSGTDGVGTKLKLAFATGRHDGIGADLVGMCVNDVVTCGARPLFFLDYFGTGKLELSVAEAVIGSIARACEASGCALLGGETAELPGMYADGEYDLAGFALGVVARKRIVDGKRVAVGDTVIAVASSGLHSNGYSLARRVLLGEGGIGLDATPPELNGKTVADALLEPTKLYAKLAQAIVAATDVRAMSHITGGGLPGNLPRVLPDGFGARLAPEWSRPAIFELIARLGPVDHAEMLRTFNMGIGFIAIVSPEEADKAIAAAESVGERAWVAGNLEAVSVDMPFEERVRFAEA